MKTRREGERSGREGVAILYAVFGAFVAASMVSVMLTMASVTSRRAEVKQSTIQAQYLAEGAIEVARKEIVDSLANWAEPPQTGTALIGNQNVPYTIASLGAETIVTDAAGMQTIVEGYEVQAVARVGNVQETAHRIINARTQPIFQFAVYYTNDLEINPGPNMRLGGRVHSNRDMYLGCGNTLTMDTNYVRAVGEIHRRRKDNDNSLGNVTIRKWVENPFDGGSASEFHPLWSRGQLANMGISSDGGYDSDFMGHDADGDGTFNGPGDLLPFTPGALDFWGAASGESGSGHTLLDGSHGVTEASTPRVGSIQMYEQVEGGSYSLDEGGEYVYEGPGLGDYDKGYYHSNAGLSIIVDADGGGWTAYDGDGNDVTLTIAGTGAVTLSEIYDARQTSNSGKLATVKVDIGELGAAGAFPSNGLLYAAHYGTGEGLDAKGVEIVNGAELTAPLTVVTEGSAYLIGDYNTENKKGAAIIGDAVNLLSNDWIGRKTQGTLPSASATTYNVAIVTGNHDTVGSSYNGGLENLPRFHESWSGVDCRINGSFVNTWSSVHATGTWVYGGDRYTAPNRVWAYDTMFNNVANLPPFTPMVVTAENVVSW